MPPTSTIPPAPAGPAASERGAATSRLARLPRQALSRFFDGLGWVRVRTGVDAVVLYVACGIAVFGYRPISSAGFSIWLTMTFPLLILILLNLRPGPDSRLNGRVLDTAVHVLGVVSIGTILMLALTSLFDSHPVQIALRLWVFTAFYLAASRCVLLSIRRGAMRSGAYSVPTLVVGAGAVGTHLVRRLADDPGYGLRPVGLIDSDPLGSSGVDERVSVPVVGGINELTELVAATGARHVILAFSKEPDWVLVQKVHECQKLGIDVSLVPRLFESINDRAVVDYVGGMPLITLRAVNPLGWQFAVKHLIDRGVAAITLVCLSPLMIAIAIVVWLTSPGPPLFRQRRVGRDGHEFDVLKFRTMRVPETRADAFELERGMAPGGIEGTDRRTPVGRLLRDLSLDELPQLINVVRGDMSLVGPRPERPEFVALFVRDVARYEERHRVKSGITGWAQVHGLRGQTSIADRVEWDNYYIQNWSLRLDLRILALTVAEVLRFRS